MELLPPIAAGRLEDCSIAELVASAFQANVTGTLVVEEGRTETRLYLRYGAPCGVERPGADDAVVEVLVEEGILPRLEAERTGQQARARFERHVDALVRDGLLPPAEVERVVALSEWRKLLALTALRVGRYELRGWERPPSWTEGVALDAFRFLVVAFQTETLADRSDALARQVGDASIAPGPDFDFLQGRVGIEPHERKRLQSLRSLAGTSGQERALALSALCLGLLEVRNGEETGGGDYLDASFFLTPVPSDSGPFFDADAVPFDDEAESLELDIDVGDFTRAPQNDFALDDFELGDFDAPVETQTPVDSTRRGAEGDLFSDIGDLVADLDEELRTGPISIDVGPVGAGGGDVLALAFAREVEAAEEGLWEDEVTSQTDVHGDDMALEMALESSTEELSGRVEISSPVEVTRPPDESASPHVREPTSPVDSSREDVRKRLLQRAFRSLGGQAFRRDQHVPPPPPPSPASPRPPPTPRADPAFERELRARLALQNEDHFKRLGVARTAGDKEVKGAFLALAKRFHPDKLPSGAESLQTLVRDVFGMIKDSYDVLSDPGLRARYLAALAPDEPKGVTHDPKLALAAFQRAKTILARQDLASAEPELARAVALDPQSEYLAELAWTLYSNKLRRDAAHDDIRDLVKRALEAKPLHDRALVVAAFVARVDGQADASEKFFRRALALNPANAVAQSEVRLLESRKKRGFFGR